MDAGTHWLWPTPIGIHRYADAATLNPLLVEAFAQGRAAQERKRGVRPGPFFASDDALGGAFVDAGNAYLLPPHVDIEPLPGQLVRATQTS